MKFKMVHMNINVQDLDRSIKFYEEALNMKVARQRVFDHFTITFLEDELSDFKLELTYLNDHADKPYDLGENESHLCFQVDDYEAAHKHHKEMGVICYENNEMGLYFIEDPDGYWIEIVPVR